MNSQPRVSLQCSLPSGQKLSTGEIDAWELKAARRGLHNLKTLLQGQPMLDLLAKQIEEGDAYFKSVIAKSNGQFKESRVDFRAEGITSSQFLEWFKIVDTKETSDGIRRFYLDIMAPAHPEHYALGPYPIGIVETIGQHICRVRMDNTVEVPGFVRDYGDSTYDKKLPVTCYLDDGTVFFYGFQEIRDTEYGCDFRIRIIFPAASPQILFDEHTEHLAIEFRSWITAASESYHK
ncbi:hypothetical protein V492_06531 [Pseudogymnoascus sp. VKM F-4246]|nr:hypothetical protein V492_06531 [Pseudogymnoascus sp. VKM F-4246]